MKTADVMPMQRFLKFRSVSSDQHICSVFGIPSGVGQVISVNQNLLPVSFLTNHFIIAVLFSSLILGIRKRNKTWQQSDYSWLAWLAQWLRRRNTRYKNPQLVAQHCFVASFRRYFPFFTLRDQLDPQQKHLLQVEESCCEKKSPGLL